jgi:hypothetical protein
MRADLRDSDHSHLAMPPMAVPIAITFCKTQWDHPRTDDARSLPPRLQKSYTAIYGQRLCNDTTMITDFFRQLMGRVQEVEQRSQIVWQLRMGSIITPNILKWLADTIRDCHCQLSYLAPDRTTESDRCERAICANSILPRQKVNES